MTITASSVRLAHPEFASVPDAVIDPIILSAIAMHDPDVWGDLLDVGADLKACDLLARSPFAREMRLVSDGTKTIYQEDWERLRNQRAHAYRVLP